MSYKTAKKNEPHERIDDRYAPVRAKKSIDLSKDLPEKKLFWRRYDIDIGEVGVVRDEEGDVVRVDFLPSDILGLATRDDGAVSLGFLGESDDTDMHEGLAWSDWAFGFLGIIHIYEDDRVLYISWADDEPTLLPFIDSGCTSDDPSDVPDSLYDEDEFEDEFDD